MIHSFLGPTLGLGKLVPTRLDITFGENMWTILHTI